MAAKGSKTITVPSTKIQVAPISATTVFIIDGYEVTIKARKVK